MRQMKINPLAYVGILSPIIYAFLDLMFQKGHLKEWDYGDWFSVKFWLFLVPMLSVTILFMKKQKRPMWFLLLIVNLLILTGIGADLFLHMVYV